MIRGRRRVYVPCRGVARRLVGWVWRHPYLAVWLLAGVIVTLEKGW